jgi:hypothetical protein
LENKENTIEDLKRILFKMDSSINLMVNGRFIPAYEKMKGMRHILCNIINSMQDGEGGNVCSLKNHKESAEMPLNSEKDP